MVIELFRDLAGAGVQGTERFFQLALKAHIHIHCNVDRLDAVLCLDRKTSG